MKRASSSEALRASIRLQNAVLRWDEDLTLTQPDARAALREYTEAMNALHLVEAKMRRQTEMLREKYHASGQKDT